MKKRLMALVLCLTVMMTMFAPLANATEEDLLSTPTSAPAAATVEPQAESAHESAAPTAAHTEQPSAQPAETVGQPVATAAPAATAASPVEEAVSGMIAVTAGSDVNLRTAPGRDSESLGKIAQSGTAVKPLKKVTLPGGEVWYAVEYEGCTGYIFGDLLTLSAAPAAAETPVAAATPETSETPETPAPVITEPDAVYTYEFSNTTSEVIYGYEATATLGQSVSVPRNGRVVLSGPAGQWQILVGGVWADLAGADSGVALTYALLKNAGSSTRIRCLDAAGNSQGESAVTLTDAVSVAAPAQEPVLKKTPLRAAAPAAVANAGEGEQTTCTIIINYVFADGKQAANPWTATVAKGSSYAETVTSPTVVGYSPDQATVQVNVTDIQQDTSYKVTYNPAEVNFTVKHYQQNVDNDNYTLADTETKTGYTESPVGDNLKKSYNGFTALLYDTTTKIAADGSTEVEIYYDRNYYLLTLNLDGGYGADPVYARYGAQISVANPQKPGYTFGGWNPTIPATMPFGGSNHKALWTAGNATYLVQYWLENANDAGYSYDTSEKKTANVGNTVSGSGDKSYPGFHFYHADQNVTVKGDGTSVVNVYYKRNTYTLTFKVEEYYYGWVTKAEFKNVKYGEDTTKYWNQAPSGYLWYTGEYSSTFYTAAPDMPNDNLTIYGRKDKGSSTIHYYEEGTTTSIKEDLKIGKSSWSFTSEDYIAIPGFTFSSTKTEGSNYYIYYTRNSYKLDFNNHGNVVKSETVPYEKALSTYNFTPEYPSGLEVGAYQFDGWYTDPGYTVAVDWTTAKMPYHNTILYAKWAPVTHTVKTFKTKDAMSGKPIDTWTVDHRGLIEEPKKPENGSYEFVGWFYEENDVEKAFDFSMPITKDLNLYAKWSSKVMVEYTIKYELEDGTEIAAETTGSALAGSTKTFEAKTGTQLNEGYQSGYFPKVSSHSLTMDIEGNAENKKNEFTFVYVAKQEVEYTVRYLDKATGEPVVVDGVPTPDKVVKTGDAVVTETFKQITGYAPDAYQKRLVLAAEGNEIIFWYTKDEIHAPVQIIHWTQNIEGDGYTEHQSSTNLNGVIGTGYSETPLTLDGFTYKADKSNSSGTLTAAGLVLNLYYDRIEYPYEFRFLEQGTDKKLAEPVTGRARYQKQVTENAKNIPGYTKVIPAKSDSLAIQIGTGENVATFYYQENTVNIEYKVVGGVGGTLDNYTDTNVPVRTGTVNGSTPTAAVGYRFVGWFKDEAGTQPVDSDWVVSDKITPERSKNLGNEIGSIMVFEAATYYAKFVKQTNVTIEKQVTGNLGDKTREFEFQYSLDGKTWSDTFTLKHGDIFTTPQKLDVGATIYVREKAAADYSTTASYTRGDLTVDDDGGYKTVRVTVLDSDKVTFTNNKEATPDTGVLLDSLPYVVILAVVVLGAALVIVRRRKHRDDD